MNMLLLLSLVGLLCMGFFAGRLWTLIVWTNLLNRYMDTLNEEDQEILGQLLINMKVFKEQGE